MPKFFCMRSGDDDNIESNFNERKFKKIHSSIGKSFMHAMMGTRLGIVFTIG